MIRSERLLRSRAHTAAPASLFLSAHVTLAIRVAILITLGAICSSVAAQMPAAQARGVITGVVFDSLVRNAPLPGAEITIDGTDLSAVTDAAGRFTVEHVPKSRAVVRFYHPLLDSLGFGSAPVAVDVPDSGRVAARLATPSPARLRSALCAGAQPASTGVVLGRVRNVDDGAPLAGATVNASWSEWSIGGGGMVRTDRHATTTAIRTGAFALCGVPNDVPVVIRAAADGHVTGLVEIDLARKLFGVRDLAVSVTDSGSLATELARMDSTLARGDSVRATGASIVTGVVRGSGGRIVDRAQVAMLGYPVAVRTGSDGQYALTQLPAGTQTVDVRSLGFAPVRLTIDLGTGERRSLDVTLDDAKAQDLAPVNIVGKGTRLDRTGFDDRRKAGLGQYITDEDIKRRGVYDTQQALWSVLGARVIWTGSANAVVFTRESGGVTRARTGTGFDDVAFSGSGLSGRTCGPVYWVDGTWFGAIGDDIDRVVRPHDIRGMEVYVNPGAAPPTYRRGGDECGIVLIWTKPPTPKQLKPDFD